MFALSVASTVDLLRILEARGQLNSNNRKIAFGWLIVEDLVMVLVLDLLHPLTYILGGYAAEGIAPTSSEILTNLGITFGKMALFLLFMLLGGRHFFPWLLKRVKKRIFEICRLGRGWG